MKENPSDHLHAGRGTALALAPRTALAAEAGGLSGSPDPLEQTLHVRDVVRVLLKRKWTILVIFLVFQRFFVSGVTAAGIKG